MKSTKIEKEGRVNADSSWFSIIFVPCADQPSILHAHIPLLIEAVSLASPWKLPVRLVSLPQKADERLSAALGLPRTGMIGLLEGAPEAAALVELVRMKAPVVNVPWLQEAVVGDYLPVTIKAIETSVPVEQKVKGATRQKTDEQN